VQHWCPPPASFVPLGGNACDFCTTCPAIKLFSCSNFELNGLSVFRNDSGRWAACRKCADFIDAERWSSLAERAFQRFMKHHAVPRNSAVSVRIQFADLVRLFAAHRRIHTSLCE